MMPFLTYMVSPEILLLASILTCVAYSVSLTAYRLYFSRLASFPGSKLAAATYWYEFYFDWWLGGKFIFEIERLHKEYGPIIRINPNELSIQDPEFYNEVYVSDIRRRTDHYDVFAKGLGFDDSFLLTTDHDLHRNRRKPFEAFFSKKGIASFQPAIARVALKLENRLTSLEKGHVVRLDHAFSCYSGDIMARLCMKNDESSDQFLSDPNFAPDWYNVVHTMVRQTPLFTGFPWLIRITNILPENFLSWAFPDARLFGVFTENARQHISKAAKEVSDKSFNPESVFHHILKSDMPASEKTEDRLTKEAQAMLAAGTVTTARTIAVASYYILSRPELRSKLEAELHDIMSGWPDTIPPWAELEQLPLLEAIIKETLRITYGVMHRLPRISPDIPLLYRGYMVPAGVPVGMSAYLMHSDPKVYPSPNRFIPERWIGDIDPAMHRSWVPFCKGSRNCIGMNLAKAEMSLILAVLFRANGPKLDLFETDESDVKMVHDFLIPLPKLDTKGVRAIIR
ncbi:cytochrome P450 [Annulohypoxylon nitens]|nr:cytochrome P450 [Annulohypoxylon nitens]